MTEDRLKREGKMTGTKLDEVIVALATDVVYNGVIGPSHKHLDESEERCKAIITRHIRSVFEEMGVHRDLFKQDRDNFMGKWVEVGIQLSDLRRMGREIMAVNNDDCHTLHDARCAYCRQRIADEHSNICPYKNCVVHQFREVVALP